MDDKQKIFLDCFNPLRERLWRFCLNLSNSREAAKDLLQDTIETAYRSFDSIKHKEAFLSYLFTVASRNFYKVKREQSRFEPISITLAETLVANTIKPETKAEIALLYIALDKLPAEMKESIVLYDIMGFSRNEICEIQGISIEALKARLYRGRNKLAELLGVNQDIENSEKVISLKLEGEII